MFLKQASTIIRKIDKNYWLLLKKLELLPKGSMVKLLRLQSWKKLVIVVDTVVINDIIVFLMK